MKQEFVVFGNSNSSIGIVLDSLHSVHGNTDVVIVSHIIEESIAYLHSDVSTTRIYIDDWIKSDTHKNFIISSMDVKNKIRMFDYFDFKHNIIKSDYTPVIHSSAIITNGVTLSNSVNISPLSVIAQYAELGDFVTINRNCSIGHHTTIGNFTAINPGCNIGGECTIGNNVTIGIGSTIFDRINIGDNSIIGGGSVVTKDVAANTLVYGSPAKLIRAIK